LGGHAAIKKKRMSKKRSSRLKKTTTGTKIGNFTLDSTGNLSSIQVPNPYTYNKYGKSGLTGSRLNNRSRNVNSPSGGNIRSNLTGSKSTKNINSYVSQYKVGAKKLSLADRLNYKSNQFGDKINHKRINSLTVAGNGSKNMTLEDIVEVQRVKSFVSQQNTV
jgi:hypothetical protein